MVGAFACGLALSLSACADTQKQAEAVTQACAAYAGAVSEAVNLRAAGKLAQDQRDLITQAVRTAGPVCENPANYTSSDSTAAAAVNSAAQQIKGAL